MRFAILGGTGPEGLGIAVRLMAAGESVIIGSRSRERAAQAARSLRDRFPKASLSGTTNPEAAADAETVCLTMPYEGLDAVLDACGRALDGKVVIDTTSPLRFEKGVFELEGVPEGSAAQRIQARHPAARVVGAFKHHSAKDLSALERSLEGDVLICGNDAAAKRVVAELARRIPNLRPIDAGDLRVARRLESVTALLLNLNQQHRARTSFRILGL